VKPGAGGPGVLGPAVAIVGFALAESMRRRVVAVVFALTVAFLALYALGANFAFNEVESGGFGGAELVDEQTLTGSTIFGLAMFGTLFLGSVLAVFLTIGLVRGDAESGLLQPLVARPLGRGTLLVARYVAAATAAGVYVFVVYAIALVTTLALGEWSPDHPILPGLALALAVAIVAAISVLASVFMSATAQGIAVFMTFGAGLVAGLLGQIGEALDSRNLERISEVAALALPFEALYQGGLYLLTSETVGITGALVELGPFGGAHEASAGAVAWSIVFVIATIAVSLAGFARRDL
jgi:Cu-processing system permease protein